MDGKTTTPKGLYARAVQWVTDLSKPFLHRKTEAFIADAVHDLAPDNPRYADIIGFEVRRRGYATGITQDFAEPIIWTSIKTVAALGIAAITKSLENRKIQFIGYAAALGLILNNAFEYARALPRYKSALQGSLEMAKDRWLMIETTGVDPFSQQFNSPQPQADTQSDWVIRKSGHRGIREPGERGK